MRVQQLEFWARVIKECESVAMSQKIAEMRATRVSFEIGSTKFHFELHRGRIGLLEGGVAEVSQVTVAGPAKEWNRLLEGKVVFAQAISIHHGTLSIFGDSVVIAWVTPALWEVVRVARQLHQGCGRDD